MRWCVVHFSLMIFSLFRSSPKPYLHRLYLIWIISKVFDTLQFLSNWRTFQRWWRAKSQRGWAGGPARWAVRENDHFWLWWSRQMHIPHSTMPCGWPEAFFLFLVLFCVLILTFYTSSSVDKFWLLFINIFSKFLSIEGKNQHQSLLIVKVIN